MSVNYKTCFKDCVTAVKKVLKQCEGVEKVIQGVKRRQKAVQKALKEAKLCNWAHMCWLNLDQTT